ncbi:MAG: GFA family protein [Alphaproteobacteria bacterium]|nr:MAG: GFA family protein [Alphaproteobacteria bacterium]
MSALRHVRTSPCPHFGNAFGASLPCRSADTSDPNEHRHTSHRKPRLSLYQGGCLCGGIRFSLSEEPAEAGYCHCRLCQLATGSPVAAFATVPVDAYHIDSGIPMRRRSSDFGERWFCADCGTPLAMRVDHEPDTIDFTIATLDTPDRVAPGFHIWVSSHISWFDTADALPRHACSRQPATLVRR